MLLLSQSVTAGLIVIEPTTPTATTSATPASSYSRLSGLYYDAVVNLKSITQVGKVPHLLIPALIGQGRRVAMADALSQIVPKDFVINVTGADAMLAVDWKVNGDWLTAVDRLLTSRTMNGELNWKTYTFTVKSGPRSKPSSITPLSASANNKTTSSAPDVLFGDNTDASKFSVRHDTAPKITTSTAFVAPKPVPLEVWKAETGKTLRQVLTQWADKAKWNVVWDASVDYPIQAGFVQTGDFLTATQKTIELYKNAETPLYGDAYPDQRLVIVTATKTKKG